MGSTSTVRRRHSAAQWEQRIERFGKSGKSVKDFCAAEGLPQGTFFAWKKRLAKTAVVHEQAASDFVSLGAIGHEVNNGRELLIEVAGVRITIRST
jgi:hypothetical protein